MKWPWPLSGGPPQWPDGAAGAKKERNEGNSISKASGSMQQSALGKMFLKSALCKSLIQHEVLEETDKGFHF